MSTTTTADGWVVILTGPGWHSIHTATTRDAAYHLAAVSLSNEDADAVALISPTGRTHSLTAGHLTRNVDGPAWVTADETAARRDSHYQP